MIQWRDPKLNSTVVLLERRKINSTNGSVSYILGLLHPKSISDEQTQENSYH